MSEDPLNQTRMISQLIYDKKGFNIIGLDVRGVSTMTDFFVVAEGSVDRHVVGMAQAIIEEFKKRGVKPSHVEGLASGNWVVVDLSEIVVHLFTPLLRERYGIEEVWRDGKIVDLQLKTTEKVKG